MSDKTMMAKVMVGLALLNDSATYHGLNMTFSLTKLMNDTLY